MKIIIVRHGETEGNFEDKLQGQLNGKLNQKGIGQSKKLAEALKNEKLDVIFSSKLGRAMETAKEIVKFHNVQLNAIPDVMERSFGIYQGTSRTKFFAKERSLVEPWKNRPEKGESMEDLYNREKTFLDKIMKEYPGKNILIISHGDVSRMLIGILLGKDVKESCQIKQANACMNVFEDGKLTVFNSTEHLGNLISRNKSEI